MKTPVFKFNRSYTAVFPSVIPYPSVSANDRYYFKGFEEIQNKTIIGISTNAVTDQELTPQGRDTAGTRSGINLRVTLVDNNGFTFIENTPLQMLGVVGINTIYQLQFNPGRIIDIDRSFIDWDSTGVFRTIITFYYL